jgi:hypothetical protein
MRAEERGTDNVIPLRRPQEAAEPVNAQRSVREGAETAGGSPATVLNAERGIINTGIVHGGQHVTTIETSGRSDGGADRDI